LLSGENRKAILIIRIIIFYRKLSHWDNFPRIKKILIPLYEYFLKKCEEYDVHVEHGIFGADMKVELLNDGPFTVVLEDI